MGTSATVPVPTLALLHPLATGFRLAGFRPAGVNPAGPGLAGPGQAGADGEPGRQPDREPDGEPALAMAPSWAARLASGQPHQVRAVHEEAVARLRWAGWRAVPAPPEHAAPDGRRVAAALVPRCRDPWAVLRLIAFDPAAEDETARRPAGQEEPDTNPEQAEEP